MIDALLSDLPQVHTATGAPDGVWRSDIALYRFLAEHVGATSVTLETGCGASTALFATLGARHTCVVASEDEVVAFREYAARRSLPEVRFAIGPSDHVLPRLVVGEIDTFLIDGCHGYPMPIVDWFYGARWLRRGGWCIVDDIHLPALRSLERFMDADPRWRATLPRERTWGAWERLAEGDLAEEWNEQGFLGEPRP